MKRFYLLLLLTSVLMVACGPGEAEVAGTIEAEVRAAVEATVAAIPPATARPTYTAEPTFTPFPTYTPQSTFTPVATYTPYPTYTLEPTETPLPTDTATPLPTPIPTVAATSAAAIQPTSTAGTTGAFTAEAVMNSTRLMDSTIVLLHGRWYWTQDLVQRRDPNIDCAAFLASHNQFVSTIVPPVSSSDPVIQGAYSNYQTATNIIIDMLVIWVDSCQQAIANEETRQLGNQDAVVFTQKRMEAYRLMELARIALGGS